VYSLPKPPWVYNWVYASLYALCRWVSLVYASLYASLCVYHPVCYTCVSPYVCYERDMRRREAPESLYFPFHCWSVINPS